MPIKLTSRICLIIVISLFSKLSASSISIDHVDGAYGTDSIGFNQNITFHIKFYNTSNKSIMGSTNGFKFYSPDGAKWDSIVVNFTGKVTENMYNTGFFFNSFSNDGQDIDTIGFGGFSYPPQAHGIPAGFDDIVATFSTKINSSYAGNNFCIDTAFFPPGGAWIWSFNGTETEYPDWSGPYCYTIADFTTSIDEIIPATLPDQVILNQNSPNPFNASTIIRFKLPYIMNYKLKIYNALGQTVETIKNVGIAGENIFVWDASNYSSGLYFYQLKTNLSTQTKQMVLLK